MKPKNEALNPESKNSLWVINIMTGFFDGFIFSFFSCVIAFSFFKNQLTLLPYISLIVGFLGGCMYGLSRFFGEKAEILHHHPELSKKEIEKEYALLQHIGIENQLNDEMQEKMKEERELWLKEVLENNLGWEKENNLRALKSGLLTGFGFFIAAGIIAIYIKILLHSGHIQATLSLSQYIFICCVPLFILILFSIFKARYIQKSILSESIKVILYSITIFIIALLLYIFIEKMKQSG